METSRLTKFSDNKFQDYKWNVIRERDPRYLKIYIKSVNNNIKSMKSLLITNQIK